MDVRMEFTEGLAREAQVWIGGKLLTVCDGLSLPDKRCAPGELGEVRFSYMTAEGFAWSQAIQGNPGRKRRLDPDRGWSYVGCGRVVQVMPVRVDFGLLTMDDANWSTDETLVGRFVRIPIDRLEVAWAHEPDWPDNIR